jgi:hypothetical protein
MPLYLPEWLQLRLLILYDKFKTEEFSFEEAQLALKDDSRLVAIVLSNLNKYGWIYIKPYPSDSRKKLYSLKYTNIIEKMKDLEFRKLIDAEVKKPQHKEKARRMTYGQE